MKVRITTELSSADRLMIGAIRYGKLGKLDRALADAHRILRISYVDDLEAPCAAGHVGEVAADDHVLRRPRRHAFCDFAPGLSATNIVDGELAAVGGDKRVAVFDGDIPGVR